MKNDIGNYARHAQYWDWGGQDRTEEHEHWIKFASKYGKNVLIPMCAWGETGAYMAERGFNVTAFDVTPEMVAEGNKRFGNIPGLRLNEGDVRCFNFDIQPADFCFSMDFGHIQTIDDVKKALVCINNHLRDGGCLVIETGFWMPDAKSDYTPTQIWYPPKQVYPHLKVWKTGETRNDADTGRCYISQTFYAEDDNGNVDSFDHAFYLQSYYREEWLAAFKECGFDVIGEYKNRDAESWQSGGGGFCIIEAVKVASPKKYQHERINLETDKDYILECHCRVNYACDCPWARKISYEEYRANWFSDNNQQEGFLSALVESMADERTIAEIIKTMSGEIVAYFWMPFHGEDANFLWADVQDLYVEETYRGAGVAVYLMDYAEKSARRHGAKVIRSGTGCENIPSQKLHDKLGYYQYRMEYEKLMEGDDDNA